MNQDYLFYSDTPIGIFPNLYLVADGMGGHKAGDKASSYAVERFVELAENFDGKNIIIAMSDIIEVINKELYELAETVPEYEGMGTTFVAASVSADSVDIMNIGDSRLYLMTEELRQVTHDHSLVEEMVRKGQLTKEEARVHTRKNVITRALGVEETVRADFFSIEMEEQDRILLCSDGLTNMVSDEEIAKCLLEQMDEEQAVKYLVDQANQAGGLDNITVLLARRGNEVTE
jgi:protein phosphatase